MLSRRENMKTPLCGEEKEDQLTKLLPRSVQSIHEKFEKIRREIFPHFCVSFQDVAAFRSRPARPVEDEFPLFFA